MLDQRLSHVVAVAKTGSFSKAAELVGITQSAVTKSVADLEGELGYAIFHRTSRGVLLTENGKDFVERASRLLEDARLLLKGSTTRGDPYGGVLRIGISPASIEWLLIEPLGILICRHPTIRVEVIASSSERMIPHIRNGGVDVGVGFEAALNEWPDLRLTSIAVLQSKLFVRKDHPILALSPASMRDVALFDFVTPSDSRPYGAVIRSIFESQGIDWQSRLHTIDYFPTVKRIVATSDAIGVVSLAHSNSPIFRSQFEILDDVDPFPPAPLCCATRSRWVPKPSVSAFVKTIRECFSTKRA